MKATKCIFRFAALVLTLAALICTILANLEAITDALNSLREQFATRGKCRCFHGGDEEPEDYEDWDI
jgi:hypothetical protein